MNGPSQEKSPDSLNTITNSKLYILKFQDRLKDIHDIEDQKQFFDDSIKLAIQKNLCKAVMELLQFCTKPTQTQLNQYLVEIIKASSINMDIIDRLLFLGANPAAECEHNAFSIMLLDHNKWILLPRLLKATHEQKVTAPIQTNKLLFKIIQYILEDNKNAFLPEYLLLNFVKQLLIAGALASSSNNRLQIIFQSVLNRVHGGLIALFVEFDIHSTYKFLSFLPSEQKPASGKSYKNLELILKEHEKIFTRNRLHSQVTWFFLIQNFSKDISMFLFQFYLILDKREAGLISKLSSQVANIRATLIEKKHAFLKSCQSQNPFQMSWIITTLMVDLQKANSELEIYRAINIFLDDIHRSNVQNTERYKKITLMLIDMKLMDTKLLAYYQNKYQINERRQVLLDKYYEHNPSLEHSQTIKNFIHQFRRAEPQNLKNIAINFIMLVYAQKLHQPHLPIKTWESKDLLVNLLINTQFIAREYLESTKFQQEVQLIYQKIVLVADYRMKKSRAFFSMPGMEAEFINQLKKINNPDEIRITVEAFMIKTSGIKPSPETKALHQTLAMKGFIWEKECEESEEDIYEDNEVTFSFMNK